MKTTPTTPTPSPLSSDFKDLKSLLAVPTEKKQPSTPVDTGETKTPPLSPEVGNAGEKTPGPDIAPVPPVPETKQPAPDPEDFTPAPPVEEPKAATPAVPIISYSDQALQLIMFVDSLQVMALPWLYQKGCFSKKEYMRLAELKEKIKSHKGDPADIFDLDGDLRIYNKYVDYQKLVKDIPFEPAEIDLLRNPLAAVMEKYKFQMGPEALLLTAVATVMGPRLLPLLARMED